MDHVEDFVDESGSHQVRRTAKEFEVSSNIESQSELALSEPDSHQTPSRVLERLIPFYDFGFLAQKSYSEDEEKWWITEFFWKGNLFKLKVEDQIEVQDFVPSISPLEIRRGKAPLFLKGLDLDFIECPEDSDVFVLRPSFSAAYFLASNLPEPWIESHLEGTRKLINKSFNF